MSPLLAHAEVADVERCVRELCPGSELVRRISKTVGLRVVSSSEIGLIAKCECVIVTPLCLSQMRAIKVSPCTFENGVYANLFLFRRKVAFVDMDAAQERRMRMMVLAMGGEIGFVLDKTVNVVVTGRSEEVRDPQCPRRHRMVQAAWVEALFTSKTFIEPMRFAVGVVCGRQPRERSHALKMPSVELKRIKSENRGEIMRKREKTHDIRELFVKKPPKVAEVKKEKKVSSSVDVEQLLNFTQVPVDSDDEKPVVGYEMSCSQVSPRRMRPENDPLLSLFV